MSVRKMVSTNLGLLCLSILEFTKTCNSSNDLISYLITKLNFMKTTLSNLMFTMFFFVAAALISCEGDTGPAGPAGTDGIDGVDGVDGTDGTDGSDGNANVTIISLLGEDITWTEGSYLGRTTNIFTFDTTAVTQDIVDHGTVLGFCLISPLWYALPFSWENAAGTLRQYVFHTYSLDMINLYAYQTSGVLNPSALSEYRFLLITDNTVLTKSSSGKNILSRMEQAGVDVTNYYDVMDYFGLEY